jgi:putative oxidoreductase
MKEGTSFATSTLARMLFAFPFGVFGFLHFVSARAMVPMVPLPGGIVWVYVTGFVLVAGSVAIMLDMSGRLGALAIAVLLLVFIAFVHIPGLANAQMRQMAMMNLLKDLALCGGALTWAGILGNRERSGRS